LYLLYLLRGLAQVKGKGVAKHLSDALPSGRAFALV
jgi:hypothetical protein